MCPVLGSAASKRRRTTTQHRTGALSLRGTNGKGASSSLSQDRPVPPIVCARLLDTLHAWICRVPRTNVRAAPRTCF